MVCEFYHNKAVIQNDKIYHHNQNYSKRKGPPVPPLSDQGSHYIVCIGYWVTRFMSEQSLPRSGSCIGSRENTVPFRTRSPKVTKVWGTGITTVLERHMLYQFYMWENILYTRKSTYIKSSWEGTGLKNTHFATWLSSQLYSACTWVFTHPFAHWTCM